MAEKIYYRDVGYYQKHDAPERPTIAFTPKTPLFSELVSAGTQVGVRYYMSPKLGNAYRYKFRWKNEPWFVDVTFDGASYQLWKGDGQSYFDGAILAAGDTDDAEEAE